MCLDRVGRRTGRVALSLAEPSRGCRGGATEAEAGPAAARRCRSVLLWWSRLRCGGGEVEGREGGSMGLWIGRASRQGRTGPAGPSRAGPGGRSAAFGCRRAGPDPGASRRSGVAAAAHACLHQGWDWVGVIWFASYAVLVILDDSRVKR